MVVSLKDSFIALLVLGQATVSGVSDAYIFVKGAIGINKIESSPRRTGIV